jgi:hypothetical protein
MKMPAMSVPVKVVAKNLAIEHRMPRAESYDLFLRTYDGMVEVIGLVPDPTYKLSDFAGREALFPKRWVTLGVLPEETRITS